MANTIQRFCPRDPGVPSSVPWHAEQGLPTHLPYKIPRNMGKTLGNHGIYKQKKIS